MVGGVSCWGIWFGWFGSVWDEEYGFGWVIMLLFLVVFFRRGFLVRCMLGTKMVLCKSLASSGFG